MCFSLKTNLVCVIWKISEDVREWAVVNRNEYHKSIGNELISLKSRVTDILSPLNHRGEEGRYKEDVLKTVLRRHLPESIGVNTGFVKSRLECTTQLDIILTNKMMPTLFQSTDFVITTPSAVNSAIEVKTNIRNKSELAIVVSKMADAAQLIKSGKRQADVEVNGPFYWTPELPWFGIFSYGVGSIPDADVLEILDQAADGNHKRIIECLCLGPDRFARFWEIHRDNGVEAFYGWRIYKTEQLAFSYFISNLIWQNTPLSVDSDPWFPLIDKELNRVGERAFTSRRNPIRTPSVD